MKLKNSNNGLTTKIWNPTKLPRVADVSGNFVTLWLVRFDPSFFLKLFFDFSTFQTVLVNYKILTIFSAIAFAFNWDWIEWGIYHNGRRLSQLLREHVLDLHHDRMSPQLIANWVKSSRHFVRNVLRDYDQNNSSMPKMRETRARSKLGGDVVQY